MMKKLKAFTLAEVLIAATIVGAVSILTIPTLINSIEEKITVAKVKKIYKELNNSYMKARMKYGPLSEWGTDRSTSHTDLDGEVIADHISNDSEIAMSKMLYGLNYKYDRSSTPREVTELSNTRPRNEIHRFVLADEIRISDLWINDPNCSRAVAIGNRCGDFRVDINGNKPPNAFGKDIFLFHLTRNAIVPMGTRNDNWYPLKTHCNKDGNNQFNGYGCTAWIIEKGNMDYLHKSVSWDD